MEHTNVNRYTYMVYRKGLLESLEKCAWNEKKTNKKIIERFSKTKIIHRITMKNTHTCAYIVSCSRSMESLYMKAKYTSALIKIPLYHPHSQGKPHHQYPPNTKKKEFKTIIVIDRAICFVLRKILCDSFFCAIHV